MAHMTLYEKLQQIEVKYEELNAQLSMPDVHSDSARYQKLAKMHSEYSEIVEKYREWKIIEADLKGAKQLFAESDDAEMKQMAHDEMRALEERIGVVEQALKLLLLPKDPNDEKNVILEIRAGTGGDEASLFRGRTIPDVFALRRIAGLAGGSAGKLGVVDRRHQGNRRGHSRPEGLFQAEI